MYSVRHALLASTIVGGLMLPITAFAQAEPQEPAANPPNSASAAPATSTSAAKARGNAVSEVVITGSRIRQTTYTTASPVQVISNENAQLTGAVDLSQLLQQSVIANNATQVNNFFAGFEETGGPGVNTISLRGLGAQRTLVLIDGKTLGPAGVGGTVGPIDLNTIPLSMIDRVEILKDGASSIYGSDAVAGVVNIITKKNYNGGELHVIFNPSEHGGGGTYEMDGVWGKTWSKGYLSLGFDMYRQDPLLYRQRPYFSCATDGAINPATGASADVIDPATGKDKCFNIFNNALEDAATGTVYAPNANAMPGGGPTGQDVQGFQAVGLVLPTAAATLASAAQIPYNSKGYGEADAISPVSRYTVYANGGYDLSAHAHLYTELLLNRRDSQQVTDSQFFTITNPYDPANPGLYLPLPIIDQVYSLSQRVDYGRAVLGVKGDFPKFAIFKDWKYDAYAQFSHSQATYSQDFAYADRVNATAGAPGGCDVNAIAPYGGGLTMAEAEPGVPCVPVNYYRAVANGGFTPTEAAFLYGNEAGRTIYNDYYFEATANGDLFRLPAGPVGAAVGFKLHREEIDDTPGEDFQDGNAFNYSSVGRTKGSDSIKEVYGELSIPLLKDFPLVKNLNLSASGRISNYLSYGTNETYKFGVSWQITDWLAFRASHGTAFRAPALYELFLADQVGYLAQISIDPCINYATSPVSANIKQNCAAQGIPGNYTGATSSSAEIFTGGGGKGILKPETSESDDIGFVFSKSWKSTGVKVSVDWYNFNIKNQIQEFGAQNILYQCYNSTDFPNNPFCTLFHRDLDPSSTSYLSVLTVQDNYVNVAQQIDQGLDLNVSFTTELPFDTRMTIESQNSWTFYTTTNLLGGTVNNYLGQVGQPGYVGNISFRFDHGPWTFNYYLNMIGRSSDNPFVSDVDTDYLQSGETVKFNHVVPFYTTSTISIRRRFKDLAVEVGVKNLFDQDPPVYGAEGFQTRIGTAPLTSQYDWVGRSFFIDLKKVF